MVPFIVLYCLVRLGVLPSYDFFLWYKYKMINISVITSMYCYCQQFGRNIYLLQQHKRVSENSIRIYLNWIMFLFVLLWKFVTGLIDFTVSCWVLELFINELQHLPIYDTRALTSVKDRLTVLDKKNWAIVYPEVEERVQILPACKSTRLTENSLFKKVDHNWWFIILINYSISAR